MDYSSPSPFPDLRYREAVKYLVWRGVPNRLAASLSTRCLDWGLVDEIGSGYNREYEHWLLESLAVWWHPLFRQHGGVSAYRERRAIRDYVFDLPCEPAVIYSSRGIVEAIPEHEISTDCFIGGAVLIGVHPFCHLLDLTETESGIEVGFPRETVGADRA